jgi:hypothetical protein
VRRHARTRGVTHVVAASASGERIVGALLLHADGKLALWHPEADGVVLVVEGPAGSDTAVRSAIARISDRARRVEAVIVGGSNLPSDIATTIDLGDRRLSA